MQRDKQINSEIKRQDIETKILKKMEKDKQKKERQREAKAEK